MTSAQAGTGKNYTKSDFDVLYGRWLDVLKQCDPNTMKSFADAPIVVTDKAIQDQLNTKMVSVFASDTNQEKQVYHSWDRYRKAPLEGMLQHRVWQVSSQITNDNLGNLPLVPGMHVAVTENAAMTAKVVNGSQGVLRDLKYEVDKHGNRYAVCAYVHIPSSHLQAPGLDYEVVPILPTRSYFSYKTFASDNGDDDSIHDRAQKKRQLKGPSFSISRLQLPLLPAYAFTDYKIQGRSLTNVIIDLQGRCSLQSAYVMLSHATSLKGVAIMRWFDPSKIYK
jgi:hypothetical protein